MKLSRVVMPFPFLSLVKKYFLNTDILDTLDFKDGTSDQVRGRIETKLRPTCCGKFSCGNRWFYTSWRLGRGLSAGRESFLVYQPPLFPCTSVEEIHQSSPDSFVTPDLTYALPQPGSPDRYIGILRSCFDIFCNKAHHSYFGMTVDRTKILLVHSLGPIFQMSYSNGRDCNNYADVLTQLLSLTKY